MKLYVMFISKRQNSTMQPSGGTEYDVFLKQDTSIINPTFIIDSNNLNLNVNYCRCTDTGRYYFIRDIICRNDHIYELVCEIDVLASFKAQIIAKTANIMYAADSSANIVDRRIPIQAGLSVSETDQAMPQSLTPTRIGIVVLGIMGAGSVGNYVLEDSGKLFDLMDGVDNWWSSLSIGSVEDAIKQLVFSGGAPQCLHSAIALPVTGDTSILGSNEPLFLGGYPCKTDGGTAINGLKVTTRISTTSVTVTIPWVHTGWRRHAPYSNLYLYVPFFGTFSLPTNDLINDASLIVHFSLNYTSGDLSMTVEGNITGKKVIVTSTNIAMQLLFGSSGVSMSGTLKAGVTGAIGVGVAAAATIATGGGAAPIFAAGGAMYAGVAASTFDAANSAVAEGGGGGGAMSGLTTVIQCTCLTRQLSDEPANLAPRMGIPFFKADLISNHTGYIQTDAFDMDGSATSQERTLINNLMNSGVFIE